MKYLVVDDHPLVLKALESELCDRHECLFASCLSQALDLARRHADLDLAILDLHLPDSPGMQGLIAMRNAAPAVPVLILSGIADAAAIRLAMEYGAAGFVVKSTHLKQLRQAIDMVADGGTYLPAELCRTTSAAGMREPDIAQTDNANSLTQREQEILSLLAIGLSNKAIANRLSLSENTVRVHVANIIRKLEVSNRTEAASKFLRSAAGAPTGR